MRRRTSAPADKARVDALRAQGLPYRTIATQLNSNYSAVRRLALMPPPNGTPDSAPDSAPNESFRRNVAVHPSAPESAPRLDELERRLGVVEAFIATLQRQALPLNGAPNGVPECTLKRGFVIAADLSRQIDAHAETQHLQVKQILDMALREYFARRGWPPAGGER